MTSRAKWIESQTDVEILLNEIDDYYFPEVRKAISLAIAQERERCVKICNEVGIHSGGHEAAEIKRQVLGEPGEYD